MANEYFQPGSVPAPNAPGSSAVMRQEFASIAAGFDKLPIMAGHPGEIVAVDGTGTKLITTGAVVGDYVTKDGVFTLTNKTIAWADNIWPGFGDAATRNAGKMAGQVLLLENNMQLPAIDGSLLTGLNAGMVSGVVQILQGGTGASDVAGAQAALGIDLKAPIFNPVFTGAPSAPTPPTGDTSSRLATTWFVTNTINAIGAVTAGSDLPLMDGVASAGNLSLFAASRQDHVHPSDTSRAPASAATAAGTSFAPAGSIGATDVQAALQELDTEKAPLASPTFTGVPQAPTVADPSDTTDKIATTAWVQTRLVQIPVGVQLSNSNAQNLGTNPGPGVGVEASRWDHVHAFPIASQIPSVATGDVSATNVQAAIAELASEKSPVGHTHVAADVTNLSAALVPFTPTGTIAANNVQAAVAEVASEAVQKTSATGAALMPTGSTAQRPVGVAGHFRLNSEVGQWEGFNGAAWVAVGQGNAASTPFTPSGNIIATNVQAAIQELDTEKVPYTYLSATNTPFTPSGNIAANNVQAALQEVDTETQAGLATKVSKSGDTMSGPLTIDYPSDTGLVVKGSTEGGELQLIHKPSGRYVLVDYLDASRELRLINLSSGSPAVSSLKADGRFTVAAATEATDAVNLSQFPTTVPGGTNPGNMVNLPGGVQIRFGSGNGGGAPNVTINFTDFASGCIAFVVSGDVNNPVVENYGARTRFSTEIVSGGGGNVWGYSWIAIGA